MPWTDESAVGRDMTSPGCIGIFWPRTNTSSGTSLVVLGWSPQLVASTHAIHRRLIIGAPGYDGTTQRSAPRCHRVAMRREQAVHRGADRRSRAAARA